jgi:hypothetical protein
MCEDQKSSLTLMAAITMNRFGYSIAFASKLQLPLQPKI